MSTDPIATWLEQPPPRATEAMPSELAALLRKARLGMAVPFGFFLLCTPFAAVVGGPVGAVVALVLAFAATAALWRRRIGTLERALRYGVLETRVVHAARRVKLVTSRPPPIAGLEIELRHDGAEPDWAYLFLAPPSTAEAIGTSVGVLRVGQAGALVFGLPPGMHQAAISNKPNTSLPTVRD